MKRSDWGEKKGEGRRAKEEGRRAKGEGRREKGEGRREKGEGRREKGEGRRETEWAEWAERQIAPDNIPCGFYCYFCSGYKALLRGTKQNNPK
jgi:hypothetical protein